MEKNHNQRWTQDQVNYLETWWGTHSIESISKAIGRDYQSVRHKAQHLGLGGFTDSLPGIPPKEIALLTGISYRNILTTWVERYGLKCKKIGRRLSVREQDLFDFMKNHTDLWQATKCEEYFFHDCDWFQEKLKYERETGDSGRKIKPWTDYERNQISFLRRKGYQWREIDKILGHGGTCAYSRYMKEVRNK